MFSRGIVHVIILTQRASVKQACIILKQIAVLVRVILNCLHNLLIDDVFTSFIRFYNVSQRELTETFILSKFQKS